MEVHIACNHRGDVFDFVDVEALALFAMKQEQLPENTEVSISFVDNDTIHDLNKRYRGIDRPTDVLSFECDAQDTTGDFGPTDELFELGDVIIAPDVCFEQTKEYGTTFTDELSLLIVHGLLHLCGYDHMKEDEALVMEQRERDILSAFYKRPFIR